MIGELRVYPDPAAVAHALAELFIERAKDAIAQRGSFAVALSGGTTPKAAYALLGSPPLSNAIDWSRVRIFFGDERCVPPDDAQSNYKMARDTFLQSASVPPTNVFRMQGEVDPVAAARAYRDELVATLGEHPRLDLAMLGMGNDGHTASLFPGTDPLTDNDEFVRAVFAPSQAQWRITLTPKVLNASRTVAFAVEGQAKAKTLSLVREGPRDPRQFPAQSIAPASGVLIWLVDRAAAGGLDNRA